MITLPLRKWSPTLEVATQPSLTVPDMSLTIPELLKRCVNNIPLPVRDVQYDDDPDIDNPFRPAEDLVDYNDVLFGTPDDDGIPSTPVSATEPEPAPSTPPSSTPPTEPLE